MEQYIIQAEKIQKIYKIRDVNTTALKNINLKIDSGEFTSIMGPSGCGKTTLLNILGLLDSPTKGEYYFLGTKVTGLSEGERSKLRKGNIGFIFQNFNLIDEMTVYENIELPLLYLKTQAKERKSKISNILEYMGIGNLQNRYPFQLSGGEQQRVALSRAIVFKPKLLLADEPTGNLDLKNSYKIMQLLSQLNGDGITIVLVTHEQEYAKYGKRIINISDGRIFNNQLQI